jgi:hypothetical protein
MLSYSMVYQEKDPSELLLDLSKKTRDAGAGEVPS